MRRNSRLKNVVIVLPALSARESTVRPQPKLQTQTLLDAVRGPPYPVEWSKQWSKRPEWYVSGGVVVSQCPQNAVNAKLACG